MIVPIICIAGILICVWLFIYLFQNQKRKKEKEKLELRLFKLENPFQYNIGDKVNGYNYHGHKISGIITSREIAQTKYSWGTAIYNKYDIYDSKNKFSFYEKESILVSLYKTKPKKKQ